MNGLDEEQMSPQNFLYGCVVEAGKEVVFNPEDDEVDHQLDLRMACVDPSTKDQLNVVEVEGHNSEGQKVKAVLVSLKPSTLPSVCLGGFTISPPAVFRLKSGSGPVHLSGQHLIMMEPDQSFGEEEEEEEEEEDEEEEVEVKMSNKRPAASPASKPQKKMKIEMEDDDEDEDEDDEEDDEESEEEESPVKAKPTPTKQKKTPQNGKSPAPSTPASKQGKSPKAKGEKTPKTPSPKTDLTVPEIKAKILEATKKGVALPKVQSKFENFLKHGQKVSDSKVIAELWKWRQTLTDDK